MILDANLLQAVEEQIVLDARVTVERLRRATRRTGDDQLDKDVADVVEPVEPIPGRVLSDEEINRLGIRVRGWHLFAERGSEFVGATRIHTPLDHPEFRLHVSACARKLSRTCFGGETGADCCIFAAEHYNRRLLSRQPVSRFIESSVR